ITPSQVEWDLVVAITTQEPSQQSAAQGTALEECLAAGMLHLERGVISFRHELARQAVEGALSPARRRALHAQFLHELLARGAARASLARLVHHAAAAEDAALVLRFAPEAARQAAARGAHREAVAHYRTALHYTDRMTLEQQADLLDRLYDELYLTAHM